MEPHFCVLPAEKYAEAITPNRRKTRAQGRRAAPRLALFLPRWQTVDTGREAAVRFKVPLVKRRNFSTLYSGTRVFE